MQSIAVLCKSRKVEKRKLKSVPEKWSIKVLRKSGKVEKNCEFKKSDQFRTLRKWGKVEKIFVQAIDGSYINAE